MNLAQLSIKRPIFITCLVILMLVGGTLSLVKLPVDLFPNVVFPIVTVSTIYPGAGPEEIETLITKPLEEEFSTVSGVKTLRSINREGVGVVVAEFTLETDVKYAEQQIRDRVSGAKRKLPSDINEPIIRRIDPADQPILIFSLRADLSEGELFDVADQVVRPKLEQVSRVGLVEIYGGRKREIRVELDRNKLKEYEVPATLVASRIGSAGQNIPAGTVDDNKSEKVFRTLGEFRSLNDIEQLVVSFVGNDISVPVSKIGKVVDSLEEENSRTFVNGKQSLLFYVYRQSGSNTLAVTQAVQDRVTKINAESANLKGKPVLTLVRDGAKPVRANVADVKESIFIGIALTILVVFFFLGSARSTLITGLALPNSLLGAFVLMAAFGFTINVMTLLALSLAVGLLIDDAIVVRENIFRHIEEGKSPIQAALDGTTQVTLAVIATTLTVIAVFGPIAFLQGVVGQFFKEFGFTICFAMAISLFDALTIAPMLSAYFAGNPHAKSKSAFMRPINAVLDGFNRFQTKLEDMYEVALGFSLRRPFIVLGAALLIFVASILSLKFVPKTFLPPQDTGEFSVSLETPPGTSLEIMTQAAEKVDAALRAHKEIENSVLTVGNKEGQANVANFFVTLVPADQRTLNTSQMKERLREEFKAFAELKPAVKDYDAIGAGQRPFNLAIVGSDMKALEEYSNKVYAWLKDHPGLVDTDTSSRDGKPEFQVVVDNSRAEKFGVTSRSVGAELRTLVEGAVPAVYRENGREYDIRVRLQDGQRDLEAAYKDLSIPNINNNMVRVSDVARPVKTVGPATINRQDRGRYVLISGDLRPGGPGMGGVIGDIRAKLADGELKIPEGMSYRFVGQAENFQELVVSMLTAAGLGILFIYLVLASLYESFVTPLTIMLVLPLAACGAFYALLITRASLDIFSMIGCVMLLGVATKNSILLVDATHQLVLEGKSRAEAIIAAGRHRLRPILMTSFALVAGMLPVAIGLNEASKQRTSMGIAIIGGLISSTVLTLLVIPAAYSYVDRFRVWSSGKAAKLSGATDGHQNGKGSRAEATH